MGPPEFTGGNFTFSGISLPRTRLRFNGAAGIHRRKLPCCNRSLRAMPWPLQWGRRNSPAETDVMRMNGEVGVVASMGPPEFTGGNQYERDVKRRTDLAASMGPPEFTGGNGRRTRRTVRPSECFNGAAGIHRRKPPAVGAAVRQTLPGFNGAAGIHRRKPTAQATLP